MEPRLDRRDCLGRLAAVGLGTAAVLTAGCSRVTRRVADPRPYPSPPPPGETPARTVRLLQRATYGATPEELARVEKQGAETWLERQLSAPTEDDLSPLPFLEAKLSGKHGESDAARGLGVRLRSIEALHARSPYELRDYKEDEILTQLQQAAILRATYSEWQLRERMVGFWGDHFNIYGRKFLDFGPGDAYAETLLSYYVPLDLHHVVRQHALGSFPEMLKASARSPAMLGYLDNQVNRKGVPNENYARELMELHTLGVDGGYSQKDVMEVARCLTGWTIENRFLRRRGTFLFDPARHDNGEKIVLGTRIPAGGGEQDGLRVLEVLANHPSTARHISRKLVRYIRGDEDPKWVKATADTYQRTGGNIGLMLRPLLLAEDLKNAPPILKRPFDFIVSALRASNANTEGGAKLQAHLTTMGQPLHQWPMPDGYPDRTTSWTGSLLARWQFAFALASGKIGGTTLDAASLGSDTDTLLSRLLAVPANSPAVADLRRTLIDLAQGQPAERLALALASPAFQWR